VLLDCLEWDEEWAACFFGRTGEGEGKKGGTSAPAGVRYCSERGGWSGGGSEKNRKGEGAGPGVANSEGVGGAKASVFFRLAVSRPFADEGITYTSKKKRGV